MIPREVQMAIQEASSVGMTIKETKAKLREMNLPVPDSKSIRKYCYCSGFLTPCCSLSMSLD